MKKQESWQKLVSTARYQGGRWMGVGSVIPLGSSVTYRDVIWIHSSARCDQSFIQEIFPEQPTMRRSMLSPALNSWDYSFDLTSSSVIDACSYCKAQVSLASQAKCTKNIQTETAGQGTTCDMQVKVEWIREKKCTRESNVNTRLQANQLRVKPIQTIRIKVFSCYLQF